MSYFAHHYDDVRLPIAGEGKPGLRRAQLGAVHAVASHFTLRSDPALVIMPTGSGKTAVLAIAAYLLRGDRVLVLTPSRLVRGQVVEEFKALTTLKDVGVLPPDCPPPQVIEITERISDAARWEELREFDVVVGTPSSLSPSIEGIVPAPPDMFDIVMVDEAHHSAANTWNAAMTAFPNARRLLFTATPFRRDAKEIKARFVYSYPVTEAYQDGIFGEVAYIPVPAEPNGDADVAIATAAERTFREDRDAGLDHVLMVRTDSKKRADGLAEVYAQHTTLRLKTVHSGHSLTHVKTILSKLRGRELDGVICVDMMGEGFDFPQLKIAAIHSPHKSLAVTLQFIGRFARTNSENLGTAKFLAVPSDIEIEAQKLYEEQAVWKKIVPNLLTSQIERETRIRIALSSFEPIADDDQATTLDLEDISLYGLTPYHHVKVFKCDGQADLSASIDLSNPDIVHRELSDDLNALLILMRSTERPDWTHLDALSKITYDIALIYFHEDSGYLFICSSLREEWLYDKVASSIIDGTFRPLAPQTIYGALNGLTDLVFWNVGMRNRTLAANVESYRISAGAAAQKAIAKSDGNLYHRGHAYGRGWDGERDVTIGLSSASKLWSNRHARLPELVAWCDEQARRMSAGGGGVTGCELDFLQTGVEAEAIPEGVIAASWARRTFMRSPALYYADSSGQPKDVQLLDTELAIDQSRTDTSRVGLVLQGPDLDIPLEFRLDGERHIELAPGTTSSITVGGPSSARPLVQYLNAELPVVFFADGSSLEGRILTPPPGEGFQPFDSAKIEVVDWTGVDVETEKRTARADGLISIHEHVEAQLLRTSAKVIFFDDDSGEVADYLAVYVSDDEVEFELYHCKGSGGPAGGDRVGDVYEVTGQAMKSSLLVCGGPAPIIEHVRRRLNRPQPSRFVRGDFNEFEAVLELTRTRRKAVKMVIVQPGVTQSRLSPKIGSLLGMVDDSLRRAGCQFTVWGIA